MGIVIMMLTPKYGSCFSQRLLAGAEITSLLLPRAQAGKIPEMFPCPPSFPCPARAKRNEILDNISQLSFSKDDRGPLRLLAAAEIKSLAFAS